MILLFLGLAIVLTTSPLLLVASCNGRGDDGGGDGAGASSTTHAGEITGSITVSDSGEIWVSALVDEYSILMRIEIIGCGSVWTGYRLTIVSVECPLHTKSEILNSFRAPEKGVSQILEFETPQEASIRIMELLDAMGMVISSETSQSIPYAIACGWKRPYESKQIVDRMLRESSSS